MEAEKQKRSTGQKDGSKENWKSAATNVPISNYDKTVMSNTPTVQQKTQQKGPFVPGLE